MSRWTAHDPGRHVVPARPAPGRQPGAAAAAYAGPDGEVAALFCHDDRLARPAGRRARLAGCSAALDADIGRRLVVRSGQPEAVVPEVVGEAGADAVFVAEDFGPYGRERDERVAAELRLREADLVRAGSPACGAAGRGPDAGGRAVQGVHAVLAGVAHPRVAGPRRRLPAARWAQGSAATARPAAAGGRRAARAGRGRGTPGGPPVPRRSAGPLRRRSRPARPRRHLAVVAVPEVGVHRRQLLAELGGNAGHDALRTELCWREFYADVLWHRPDTVRRAFLPGDAWRSTRARTDVRSSPGPRAARATRSSTPACASSWARAGCTTGCA